MNKNVAKANLQNHLEKQKKKANYDKDDDIDLDMLQTKLDSLDSGNKSFNEHIKTL